MQSTFNMISNYLLFKEVELSPELIEKKIYLTRWINALVKPKINFSKKKEFTICSESILRTASGPDEANIFSTKENFTLKRYYSYKYNFCYFFFF